MERSRTMGDFEQCHGVKSRLLKKSTLDFLIKKGVFFEKLIHSFIIR